MKVHLIIIDGQVDFCDPKIGKLYVPGADDDMRRLADMIKRLNKKDALEDIHITMDSHHLVHIAHPIFWKNGKGEHPQPFTTITKKDVEQGTWTPTRMSITRRALDYVTQLEKNNRYQLTVWPPHCLIGTVGHTVVPEVMEALLEWESNFYIVDKITKGSNPYTEHYSAIQADVPDSSDISTQLNTDFIRTLMQADKIAVCGEAGSHCLANTVRDIVVNFADDTLVGKLVLLKDATSPVGNCEGLYNDFLAEMTTNRKKAGKTPMEISTTKEFLS